MFFPFIQAIGLVSWCFPFARSMLWCCLLRRPRRCRGRVARIRPYEDGCRPDIAMLSRTKENDRGSASPWRPTPARGDTAPLQPLRSAAGRHARCRAAPEDRRNERCPCGSGKSTSNAMAADRKRPAATRWISRLHRPASSRPPAESPSMHLCLPGYNHAIARISCSGTDGIIAEIKSLTSDRRNEPKVGEKLGEMLARDPAGPVIFGRGSPSACMTCPVLWQSARDSARVARPGPKGGVRRPESKSRRPGRSSTCLRPMFARVSSALRQDSGISRSRGWSTISSASPRIGASSMDCTSWRPLSARMIRRGQRQQLLIGLVDIGRPLPEDFGNPWQGLGANDQSAGTKPRRSGLFTRLGSAE